MQVQKAKQGYKLVKSLFGKYVEIPEDWRVEKLGNVSELYVPMRDKPKKFDGNIPWLRIEDLDGKYANDSKSNQRVSPEIVQEMHLKIYPIGTVLCSCSATIGVCSITTRELITNQTFIGIKPTKELDEEFLYYYLLTQTNHLKSIGSGSTILYISREKFEEFQIFIPKIKEQQKIASILSNIDNLIELYDKIIIQTKRLKTGLMQQLLTKGIDHKKFKKVKSLFGKYVEIPCEWNVFKISDFATVSGRIGWKNLRADEYANSGPLMLSVWSLVENIPYGIDYNSGVKRLSEFRYEESPEIKLQHNDVLVAKDGDIGRIGYVKELPEPTTVNSHVVVVRVQKENINPEYIYHYMRFHPFQSYCKSYTSGTTVPLLTQKDLKNALILIPPFNEQEKIASILTEIDTWVKRIEQDKSKLEILKKSLMPQLLFGKKLVKTK